MRTRRIVSLAAATALVIVTAASALHASINQYRSRPLDRQNIGYIQGPRQTTKTDWAQIGGWSFSDGMGFQARSGISATLSVTVTGAPAEFRIVMEVPEKDWAQRVMKPTSAHFDPQGGTGSFSYTFVAGVGPGIYTINLLWRSPSGVQTNLDDGSLVVQYAAR
ncbi:MAG: hypothetical protein ACXWYE_09220 [Actinomycetota bacterium]